MWIENSVTIDSGVQLTIHADTIHMPSNGRILVKRGGHLIVDNAVITNSCSTCFWHGLEAEGHVFQRQDSTRQGWITIKNNSVIEHAINAVCNRNEDSDFTTNGGMIQASNSIFRNNITFASFYEYDNWSPSASVPTHLLPNVSYFNNCTFLLDNNFKGDAAGIPMSNMVYMRRVDGVTFKGCSFLNRDTAALNKGLGDGIRAITSGFIVTPYYPGMAWTSSPQRSRICGFYNGIDVLGSYPQEMAATIDRVDFDSCGIGERVAVQDNVNTSGCTFSIGYGASVTDPYDANYDGCYHNIGIFTQNVNQFLMSANTFTGKPPVADHWYNIGVVVANEPLNNSIYNNIFDSLQEGVLSIGHNVSDSFIRPPEPGASGSYLATGAGLHILCNSFQHNATDISISSDGGALPQGICAYQAGFDSGAAGNTFSGSTNNIIDNCTSINYLADTAGAPNQWPPNVSTNVTRHLITAASSCDNDFVHTSGGAVSAGLKQISAEKAGFYTYKTALTDSSLVYTGLIDLGKHDSLLHVIDTSGSEAALYTTLAVASPWLSEYAVTELVNVNKLSYDTLQKVLRLNPDLWQNYDYLNAVSTAAGIYQADYDSLVASSNTVTRRTVLEAAIRQQRWGMDNAANILMTYFKTPLNPLVAVGDSTFSGYCPDSTNLYYTLDSNKVYGKMDSLNNWLQRFDRIWSVYSRAGLLYFQNQAAAANIVMSQSDSLSTAFGESVDEHTSYVNLWAQLFEAASAGRDIDHLNATEIAALDTTSTSFFSDNSAMEAIYNISVSTIGPNPNPPHPFPNYICAIEAGSRSSINNGTAHPQKNKVPDAGDFITAYPNPATGIVTFQYQLTKGDGIDILISNVIGEKVFEQKEGNLAGKIQWDTRSCAPGVYIFHATGADGTVTTGKVIVVR